MSTCTHCGGPLERRTGGYHYAECGLPNVRLESVEIRRCPACAKEAVVIPNIEGLHRTIARAVADKPGRLTPQEIRFLRKYLGYSGVDFAPLMGKTHETIARWESATTPMAMDPAAERLLRLMVMTRAPLEAYSLDRLGELGRLDLEPVPTRVTVKKSKGKSWEPVASV